MPGLAVAAASSLQCAEPFATMQARSLLLPTIYKLTLGR